MLAAAPAVAQQAVPEIPFESVPDPLTLPTNVYFGEVFGVAVNSKGHVFVFSRGNTSGPAYAAAAAQLFEFGPDGKFIREIGKNLYAWSFAHAVRIDKDDNIWAIDKGSDMIIRFNPAGPRDHGVRPQAGSLRRRNRTAEASQSRRCPPMDGRFRQPTDVAWDPQGDIFISDGYINSRIAKADKNGTLDQILGRAAATSPASSTRRTASPPMRRATSTWPIAAIGRIQVFDSDGKFLRIIKIDVPVDARTRGRRSATSRRCRPIRRC